MNMAGLQNNGKVKVFISSNCDKKEDVDRGNTKYSVMRKSLKLLLETTDMCEVYIFEEGTATSCSVENSYLNKLEDSDLVIVIVDNKDGIGAGTQNEINRIKALRKKCLYVFCQEREKESTELEKQLITSTANPRFFRVPEFADIPQIVYQSVLNEILEIYTSYCRGRIDYTERKKKIEEVDSGEVEIFVANDSDISKEFMSGFAYTRFIVKKESGVTFVEESPKSESDKNCASLLGLVIGSSITDTPDFASIKQDIRHMHKGNIQKLVGIRYEAVEAYFSGRIDVCVNKLEEAIEFIKTCKNIPTWMMNDVAIDLRNVQQDIDNEKGIINPLNHGQIILNEGKGLLYYPVIDRIISDYNENIVNAHNNSLVQSPFTVILSGVNNTVEKASNAFIVAYYYGSITHMLLTRKRICNCIFGMALEVRDHRMFMFVVRLLLLSNEEKKLRNFLEAYGENTNNIYSTDVENLLNALVKQPLMIKRLLAKEHMLRFFGYYYSDKMFEKESHELINVVKDSIESNYGAGILITPLFDAMRDSEYRLDKQAALEFIYFIFEKKYKYYYDDAFKFLSNVSFSNLSEINQKKYQIFMIDALNNVDIRGNSDRIFYAAQILRKTELIDHKPLDDAVKNNNPSFFESTYCLNVEPLDAEKGWEYTKRYIEEIINDNNSQGKGGVYSKYAYDPFSTISNIMIETELHYSTRQLKHIIGAIRGTIFTKTQTIEAKTRALELLCIMQIRQPSNRQIRKLYKEITAKYEEFFEAKDIITDKGYGKTNMSLNLSLLGAILEQITGNELGIQLVVLQHSDLSQQITALRFLERLSIFDLPSCLKNSFDTLFQFILNESYNANSDIRFYSIAILSKIKEEKYREICLERFVDIMDDEAYKNKVGLLYRLTKKELKNSKVRYIFDKGRTDSHYWVRVAASRFDVELGVAQSE